MQEEGAEERLDGSGMRRGAPFRRGLGSTSRFLDEQAALDNKQAPLSNGERGLLFFGRLERGVEGAEWV